MDGARLDLATVIDELRFQLVWLESVAEIAFECPGLLRSAADLHAIQLQDHRCGLPFDQQIHLLGTEHETEKECREGYQDRLFLELQPRLIRRPMAMIAAKKTPMTRIRTIS